MSLILRQTGLNTNFQNLRKQKIVSVNFLNSLPGIMSHAMVMCASTPEKVEILDPPSGSKPGDKVTVEGFSGTPDQQLNPKKKVPENRVHFTQLS